MNVNRNGSSDRTHQPERPDGGVTVCARDCPGRAESVASPPLGIAVQTAHRVTERKDEGWHVFAALITAVAAGGFGWLMVSPLMLMLSVMGRMQHLGMDLPSEAVPLVVSMIADFFVMLALAGIILYLAYKAVAALVVAIGVMIRLARAHRTARQGAES
jgi:hypothetical protein